MYHPKPFLILLFTIALSFCVSAAALAQDAAASTTASSPPVATSTAAPPPAPSDTVSPAPATTAAPVAAPAPADASAPAPAPAAASTPAAVPAPAVTIASPPPPPAATTAAAPVAPPTDIIAVPREDVQRAIGAGKALSIIGTVMWLSGVGLEIAGTAILMSSDYDDGLELTLVGAGLDAVAPIFSAAGEKKVKNTIGQHNTAALRGSKSSMSGGIAYAWSWAFYGLAVANLMIGTLINAVIGMICSTTAQVLRGVAAIGPLVRINRFSRREGFALGITPSLGPGYAGLGFGATF